MISIDLDESGLVFGGTEHGVWGWSIRTEPKDCYKGKGAKKGV